ncbi:CASC3 protein CASC3 [Paraeggerthella hongkongensis]|uniref:CASC3 protein CASC3 n=1 Tax=Paraeggerthella hongkongensis TaxID=230658 RepID=A0A3N0B1J1_9ACTN|nr:CASC3 protein CASC3 [Paraeggerthella hongkongensis]RNL40684.1 CASC3 protein CASC3 [Paraeggerthella hongkongensis]
MGTNQKLTAKQKSDRIKAAQDRERKDKERREAAEKTKKIFTIVVCVILVLALGIPTVALAFLGTGA